MVRWKERLARSPGCAALTRAADLAGRAPREMPRVRYAYPGYRLTGRAPREKPRVRCAYPGYRLAGRSPREKPRVRCAYPGYRLAGRASREKPRVRCAYPGYRLAGRASREKPRVRCAYPGYGLAGRTPREMPRVRCAYPGYRLAGRTPRESPGCAVLTRGACLHGLRRPAGPSPHPGSFPSPCLGKQSPKQNKAREDPGLVCVRQAEQEKSPGCTSLCNTGRSHVLVGVLPSPSVLPLWVPRVPPSWRPTILMARHPLLQTRHPMPQRLSTG